ncbi:MAG: thiamine pyrophosphate-binding protein [Candidatus Marinimicrobia bacterium]|nr:thiamine pyrophosphate-binding protein [Candidatus Neomarinimicrobiota bacterium]
MRSSDYIVSYLEKIGVKNIQGFIGGVITPLFDSIYKNPKIEFLHYCHEQAASFAASAAAKCTNTLQVAIATSGPGATNLITGIADAFFDSAPVLYITGQVNTYDFKFDKKIRQQGFQETDIVSIVKPITKYSSLISDPNQLIKELKKAVSIALSGRKGPVLLDIPFDIQRMDLELPEDAFNFEIDQEKFQLSEQDLNEIIDMISISKLPIILAGGGCSISQSKKHLIELAEKTETPVIVSLMGKDSFPHDHILFGGFIGAYGNRFSNILFAKSDLLIVLGSRLDTRQIGNNIEPFLNKKIIWVDIDCNEIRFSKLKPEKTINCDVNFFLEELLNYIKINKIKLNREKYIHILNKLKKKYDPLTELKRAHKIDWHYYLIDKISSLMKDDDVVCVDVGQNQMLAAQVIKIVENQRFINSGGMAPLGYALPAAIGISKIIGKRSIVIVGDGGMQINIQELNTVAKNKLPIIIIVLNNKSLGMIKKFQELYFEGRYSATDETSGYYSCDFKKIAQAYNIESYKIDRKTQNIEKTLNLIFDRFYKPVLLEIDIDNDTYIYPKLRFDKTIDEISPELPHEERKKIDELFNNMQD